MAGPAWHGISINAVEDKPARDNFRAINLYLRSVSKSLAGGTETVPAEGLPGEAYVTIGNTGGLTQERALAVAAPVTFSDGGANGSVTIGAAIAAPAFTFDTTAAAGSAGSLVRSDAKIALFDTTVPSALETAAATGSIAFPARIDHVHEFPETLQSDANSATFTATDDGSILTLTSSLDRLIINSNPGGSGIQLGTDLELGSGNRSLGIGIAPNDLSLVNATINTSTSGTSNETCFQFSLTNRNTNANVIVTGIGGFVASQGLSGTAGQTITAGFRGGFIFSGPNKTIPMASSFRSFSVINVNTDPTSIVTSWQDFFAEDHFALGSGVVAEYVAFGQEGAHTNLTMFPLVYGMRLYDRAQISSSAARAETTLNLIQLATGNVAGAHINLNDKAGDPPSPNAGDIWKTGDNLRYEDSSGTNNIIVASTSPPAYTPTNDSTDRSYDANATSIDELADVLGTLITDLQATGIIG